MPMDPQLKKLWLAVLIALIAVLIVAAIVVAIVIRSFGGG